MHLDTAKIHGFVSWIVETFLFTKDPWSRDGEQGMALWHFFPLSMRISTPRTCQVHPWWCILRFFIVLNFNICSQNESFCDLSGRMPFEKYSYNIGRLSCAKTSQMELCWKARGLFKQMIYHNLVGNYLGQTATWQACGSMLPLLPTRSLRIYIRSFTYYIDDIHAVLSRHKHIIGWVLSFKASIRHCALRNTNVCPSMLSNFTASMARNFP